MSKQEEEFQVYLHSATGRLVVYRARDFRVQAGTLFREDRTLAPHFANINALIRRLVEGERLSADAFRKEGPGYAFRSGQLRFYGVYAHRWTAAFVLSHAIVKRQRKLAVEDVMAMGRCRARFDALMALPT